MNPSFASIQPEIFSLVGGALAIMTGTIAVLLTSFMCRIAQRCGAVDRPDGRLKSHRRPTATLGGIPLFAALLIGLAVLSLAGPWLAWDFSWAGLALAAVVILGLGIKDDLHRITPRPKLFFQIIASLLIIGSGTVIHQIEFCGVARLYLGLLALPFTLFWLVGSCNAMNFIDGMDGLASGLGLIISLFLALLGYLAGEFTAALVALALAGALAGILAFNLRPAAIFLGDSGSQLAGLLLGMLSIRIGSAAGPFALPAAGLLLSIPVLDALLSILRRYSYRTSAASGDHMHVHHRLQHLGLGAGWAALALWSAAIVAGTMALIICYAQGSQALAAAALFVGLELYLGLRLGYADWRFLGNRLLSDLRLRRRSSSKTEQELRSLWERMKPLFETMSLDRAILTLEAPRQDGRREMETFQWVRSEKLAADLSASRWTRRFPLDAENLRMATLRLESAQQHGDEQRINSLLTQISENMRQAARHQAETELATQ